LFPVESDYTLLTACFNSFDMINGTFCTTKFYIEKYPFFPYHKYHVTDM